MRAAWAYRARSCGTTGYAEPLDAVSQYTVDSTASTITTPLLLTDPEGEQWSPKVHLLDETARDRVTFDETVRSR